MFEILDFFFFFDIFVLIVSFLFFSGYRSAIHFLMVFLFLFLYDNFFSFTLFIFLLCFQLLSMMLTTVYSAIYQIQGFFFCNLVDFCLGFGQIENPPWCFFLYFFYFFYLEFTPMSVCMTLVEFIYLFTRLLFRSLCHLFFFEFWMCCLVLFIFLHIYAHLPYYSKCTTFNWSDSLLYFYYCCKSIYEFEKIIIEILQLTPFISRKIMMVLLVFSSGWAVFRRRKWLELFKKNLWKLIHHITDGMVCLPTCNAF